MTSKPNKRLSRRKLLTLIGAGLISSSIYSYVRGIRFPRLSWEPKQPKQHFNNQGFELILTDLIRIPTDLPEHKSSQSIQLRAYAPEPILVLQTKTRQIFKLRIHNIAKDAVLQIPTDQANNLHESQTGLTRDIEFFANSAPSNPITLKWLLPERKQYTFAAIGDSGGDKELAWCIQRAHALGAQFLLHLGDFNYQEGDYQRAIKLFNEAPLPCYVSIGNHDFHDGDLVYQDFLENIGPFNHQFSIGKTRFANIDTAASFLPYHAGSRGKLLKSLQKDARLYTDTVIFTHRPLYDPQATQEGEGGHDIGNKGERNWLIEQLKLAKVKTLLCGHIHIFDRQTYDGIDNIIVGQGLGHQDLITNSDFSKMAIGHVDQTGAVRYEFSPLSMPMELHCHPRSDSVKASLTSAPHQALIEKINRSCNSEPNA